MRAISAVRNRVPPPILTVIAIAGIWAADHWLPGLSRSHRFFPLFGVIIIAAGLAIILWAGVLFKANETTVNPFRPDKTSAIVESGPYKFSRNPMYLGMLLTIIGAAFVWHALLALPILVSYWLYMTAAQITPEEVVLKEQFGVAYTDYMKRVRRWI